MRGPYFVLCAEKLAKARVFVCEREREAERDVCAICAASFVNR